MTIVRVTDIGVALPLTLLGQLGIKIGDELQVSSTDGEIRLKAIDAKVAQQVETAKQIMTQRADVLRRLAE